MTGLIALTVLLAPTYAVRFSLLGLPTNLLMVWTFFVWLAFGLGLTLKNRLKNFAAFLKSLNLKIGILTALFLTAGAVSLFWQGYSTDKLGQFVVLFLQPISLFFIAAFEWRRNPDSKSLLLTACYILLALMGIYSLIQYFTLFGLPPEYWGNSLEPKRALAFFVHPNFYSLFAAPLLAFLIPDAFSVVSNFKFFARGGSLRQISKLWKPACWIIGAIGLLLSLSRAGWLGLGVAAMVYLFIAAEKRIKKLALGLAAIAIVLIVSLPNLRWRFVMPFYGEKSAVSRFSLWQTGAKAIKESPVFGLGLTGFSQNWDRLNIDPNIDRHNFPHNIFLNLWVETGLLGLISLIGLMGPMIYRGLLRRNDIYKLGVALFLIAFLAQGLIDNPYFKNDLATVFWIILTLAI